MSKNFVFAIVFIFASICLGDTEITSVNLSQTNQLYVASKKIEPDKEIESYLFSLKGPDWKVKKLKIPESILNREIVGIFSSKEGIFVVSQNTREQGDEPLIHSLAFNGRIWKKIGQIDCKSFYAIQIGKSGLEFDCEIETQDRRQRLKKYFPIDNLNKDQINLTSNAATLGDLNVEVIRDGSQIKAIKINRNGQPKTIQAVDLIDSN